MLTLRLKEILEAEDISVYRFQKMCDECKSPVSRNTLYEMVSHPERVKGLHFETLINILNTLNSIEGKNYGIGDLFVYTKIDR